MDKREEIKALAGKITAELFPEETETFEIFSDDKLDEVLANPDADASKHKGHNEFSSDTFELIIKSAATLVGTVKTVLEVRKMLKKKGNADDAVAKWREELVKAGLSEELAQTVTAKFREDLNALI